MGIFSKLGDLLEDQIVAETQIIPQLEHFIKDCDNAKQVQVRINQLLEVANSLETSIPKRGKEYTVMNPITKEKSVTLKKHKGQIIFVK